MMFVRYICLFHLELKGASVHYLPVGKLEVFDGCAVKPDFFDMNALGCFVGRTDNKVFVSGKMESGAGEEWCANDILGRACVEGIYAE